MIISTFADLVRASGILRGTVWRLTQEGVIPAPDVQGREGRTFYSEARFAEALKAAKKWRRDLEHAREMMQKRRLTKANKS